jgi:predicted enzyme related to lactoylglutathione lyase
MAEGSWVWFDLLTTDVPGAIDFYTGVFGWGSRRWTEGGQDYPMFTVGDQGPHGGALTLRTPGLPPHWIGYVEVADLDARLAKAQSLGAKVLVSPRDLPRLGRIASLADPQGGVFDLYQPERSPLEPMRGPGTFAWHELACDDPEAAFRFYGALFGWELGPTRDVGGRVYQIVTHGGREACGFFQAAGGMPTAWLHFVEVSDADATLALALAAGGKRLWGPVTNGDRRAAFTDPNGATIALVQRR